MNTECSVHVWSQGTCLILLTHFDSLSITAERITVNKKNQESIHYLYLSQWKYDIMNNLTYSVFSLTSTWGSFLPCIIFLIDFNLIHMPTKKANYLYTSHQESNVFKFSPMDWAMQIMCLAQGHNWCDRQIWTMDFFSKSLLSHPLCLHNTPSTCSLQGQTDILHGQLHCL